MASTSRLDQVLKALGAPEEAIVRLQRQSGEITDRTADYSDLLGEHTPIEAIVECDRTPLAYIAFHDDSQAREEQARQLSGRLANRSASAALLSIDASMSAQVWRCRFDQQVAVDEFDLLDATQAATLLLVLQDGLSLSASEKAQEFELRELLKDNVRRVATNLQTAGVRNDATSDDVLALVGRAVFARFLLDREILTPATAPDLFSALNGCIEQAFDSPIGAAHLCDWLDRTFNGELLKLNTGGCSYFDYFVDLRDRSSPDVLAPLGWILCKTHTGGQLPLWDRLNFAHIPAGVLSEVYEDFAHFRFPAKAKSESIHYTPRHIAKTVVTQALQGLASEDRHHAQVLDPSVGAGVFLCLAFRELAKYEYRMHGRWPDTQRLRDILYGQLCGFDINDDALKLTALSLYLCAIELDPSPLPPEKLHFARPLIGTILYNARTAPNTSDADAFLGSLRANHPRADSRFDVVLGNPPWTSQSGREATALDMRIEGLAADVAATRGSSLRYSNPDHVPDLPFVWKSAEFLKEGGVIALVLHGRLLTKSSTLGRDARAALFRSFSVQGIVNGAELVNKMEWCWPTVAVPFCILFARNRAPAPGHAFAILTPRLISSAERRPHLRLDHTVVEQYDLEGLEAEPDLPLVLGKACAIDAAIIRKIRRRLPATQPCAEHSRGRFRIARSPKLAARAEYITLANYLDDVLKVKRGRGFKEGTQVKDIDWNLDWPRVAEVMPADAKARSLLQAEWLQDFHVRPMERSRDADLYKLPVLLIRESPGEFESGGGSVLITSSNGTRSHTVFSGSFLGVSLGALPNGEVVGKYITLLLSGIYAYHFYLLTTSFAERRRHLDIDLLTLPLVPLDQALESRSTSEAEIQDLFDRLNRGSNISTEMDDWIRRVMRFTSAEVEVMRETVLVASPFQRARGIALAPVTKAKLSFFCQSLQDSLAAHLGQDYGRVDVRPLHPGLIPGWEFVYCALSDRSPSYPPSIPLLAELVLRSYPASQVVQRFEGCVVVGRPSDHVQWLPSRASLLTRQIGQLIVAS